MARYNIIILVLIYLNNLLDLDLLSSKPANGTDEPKAILNSRILYDSCIDEDGIEADGVEPVLSVVNNEFGGWPILLGASWNDSAFNLSDLLIKLRKYDDGIMFSINTGTNQENSSVYDIEVSNRFSLKFFFLYFIVNLAWTRDTWFRRI